MNPQTQTTPTYDEQFRPQFHFSPPDHWMNDPNGLVYLDGEYHLFYQHDPQSRENGPMHWGHAISADLIHWTNLPIALYPDAIGPIWSGSAVIDVDNTSGLVPGGGMIAIFSYKDQSQGIAFSTDKGRSWTKYSHNPVIPVGGKDFRDPKVFWHADTKRWVMILAVNDHVAILTSSNLINWTAVSEFGVGQGIHWGVWECPDLFPLMVDGQTKWVLTNSMSPGTQYFVGNFDGETFTNDNSADTQLLIDYGPDSYAGVTWNDTPDGSRVLIAWMDNWRYAVNIPTTPWRGAMSIPHVLTLKRLPEGIRLIQSPIAQVEELRDAGKSWTNQLLIPGQNLLAGITGNLFDIVAEFESEGAASFGFRVHKGDDHYTTIAYDAQREMLFVDRTNAGLADFSSSFADLFYAPLPKNNNRVRLRILIDWSSVEVFGNDGEVVLTVQVFPDPTSDQIELFSVGGNTRMHSLDLYAMKRVWS